MCTFYEIYVFVFKIITLFLDQNTRVEDSVWSSIIALKLFMRMSQSFSRSGSRSSRRRTELRCYFDWNVSVRLLKFCVPKRMHRVLFEFIFKPFSQLLPFIVFRLVLWVHSLASRAAHALNEHWGIFLSRYNRIYTWYLYLYLLCMRKYYER